jgi:hypothetical protein
MYEDFKKRFNIPSAINAGVYQRDERDFRLLF